MYNSENFKRFTQKKNNDPNKQLYEFTLNVYIIHLMQQYKWYKPMY